ncbi:MAG: hypothetical protein Q7S19_03505 [bacterium]|nr:hypothetical protein [bacterium]
MDENRFLLPKTIMYMVMLAWFCGFFNIPLPNTTGQPERSEEELRAVMRKYHELSTPPDASTTPPPSYSPATANEPKEEPVSPIEQKQKTTVTVIRISDPSSVDYGMARISYDEENFIVSYDRSEEQTFDRDTGVEHIRIVYRLTDETKFQVEVTHVPGLFKVSERGSVDDEVKSNKDSLLKSLISNKTKSEIMTILETIYRGLELTENYIVPSSILVD